MDELHLMIGAVALGAGTPIFDRNLDAALEIIDVEGRDSTNNVVTPATRSLCAGGKYAKLRLAKDDLTLTW